MVVKTSMIVILGVLLFDTPTSESIDRPGSTDAVLSPAREHALALELRDKFLSENRLVHDDALVEGVRRVGRRVASFSDRPDLPYEFFVLESGDAPSEFQALSLPGGTVGAPWQSCSQRRTTSWPS